jgi:hypothetical protein
MVPIPDAIVSSISFLRFASIQFVYLTDSAGREAMKNNQFDEVPEDWWEMDCK